MRGLPLLEVQRLADLVHELEVFADAVDVHMKVLKKKFKFKRASYISVSTSNQVQISSTQL
jgi:hypothetical protein